MEQKDMEDLVALSVMRAAGMTRQSSPQRLFVRSSLSGGPRIYQNKGQSRVTKPGVENFLRRPHQEVIENERRRYGS